MTQKYSSTQLDSSSTLNNLLPTVKTLSHADKIRLMHFLTTDLVQREDMNLLEPHKDCPIWTPFDAVEAADTLLTVLAEENQKATT